MTKPLLSNEQLDVGYQRFLEHDHQARTRVESMTQEVADHLGTTLDEVRRIEIHRAISDRASALGVDEFEYLLGFAVPDAVERGKILQAQRDSISDALGL
ncbi:DUF6388 family protein [Delftia sp. DT-2]|uniref:DUF6388 family protein n=1 Tax=Delftia sp. DT-2 TaxID=3022772 RepID=UPI00233E5CF8|nr:DUF6388 family protein [Delftia sp. DT-2]MDC2858683.1 DUF6388 family protein [Delftia sp. DT-2]